MQFTGQIARQDWMTAPETVAVMAALTAEGADVRFVGGCVRDAILKRPVGDIDIATPDTPETVIKLLEQADIKAVPTGIDHGTVTAVANHKPFEITTLRVDIENYGRRAKVAFTSNWEEDAARRDFTINTLSCTPDGRIYDPFGGIDDLGRGTVKFVGIASDRVEEDLLRILRFFRFYATYGTPPPDVESLAACRALANRLSELSGERVASELLRILLAPNTADTIVLMRGEKVLDEILPEAGDVGRLRMLGWLETSALKMDSVVADGLRRLAALMDTGGDDRPARAVAERLRLSNEQRDRLLFMTTQPAVLAPDMDRDDFRRTLHKFGSNAVTDLILLAWASEVALTPRLPRERTDGWISLLEKAVSEEMPQFPLRGADALSLGVPHGPQVGRVLKDVEDWWMDGGCRADREECLEYLELMIGGTR